METIKNGLDKVKEDSGGIRKEVKKKMTGYIAAAFGLVAGLAWNDAIKSLIEYYFPASKNSVLIKFVYAFGITLVVTILIIYIGKLLKEEEEKK